MLGLSHKRTRELCRAKAKNATQTYDAVETSSPLHPTVAAFDLRGRDIVPPPPDKLEGLDIVVLDYHATDMFVYHSALLLNSKSTPHIFPMQLLALRRRSASVAPARMSEGKGTSASRDTNEFSREDSDNNNIRSPKSAQKTAVTGAARTFFALPPSIAVDSRSLAVASLTTTTLQGWMLNDEGALESGGGGGVQHAVIP